MMTTKLLHLMLVLVCSTLMLPSCSQAQEEKNKAPMTSAMQELNQLNTLPKEFTTEIIAIDEEGRKKAQKIMALYEVLSSKPTVERVKQYVRDDYIQHSPMLPDGPEGLAMFFAALNSDYPVKIDVYRIMVVGDWAMAHVNFRNLDTEDPEDLGNAGVDIYTFGPDGKLAEHWDAVQGVPTYSVNPNGMFLQMRKF